MEIVVAARAVAAILVGTVRGERGQVASDIPVLVVALVLAVVLGLLVYNRVFGITA